MLLLLQILTALPLHAEGGIALTVSRTRLAPGARFRVTIAAPTNSRCRLFFHYQTADALREPGLLTVPAEGRLVLDRRVPGDAKGGPGVAVVHCDPPGVFAPPAAARAAFVVRPEAADGIDIALNRTRAAPGERLRMTITAAPNSRCRLYSHYQAADARREPDPLVVPADGSLVLARRVPRDVGGGPALIVVHCGPPGVSSTPAMAGAAFAVRPQWRLLPPLTAGPRQEVGVVALGGEVYVIGGLSGDLRGLTTVEAFNPGTRRWRRVAGLPVGMHHANVAASGGKIYVLGFQVEPFTADGRVFEYDPQRDRWRQRTAMPAGTERGASGVAVVDGKIYVAGGGRNGSVADFSVYDPARDSWTALPPLPDARDHLAAGAIAGIIYVAGGRAGGSLPEVYAFDAASNTWSSRAPIPTPRGGVAGVAVDGRLYIMGGEGNPDDPSGVFADVEAYDPAGDRWYRLAPMRTPRHGIGAAAVDGLAYVPGGATLQGLGAVATSELFIPPKWPAR